MHTVELLELAIEAAERLNFRIRREWMGGAGGGTCQMKGQRWIFLDLAQDASEHLQLLLEVLRSEPAMANLQLDEELRAMVAIRRSA